MITEQCKKASRTEEAYENKRDTFRIKYPWPEWFLEELAPGQNLDTIDSRSSAIFVCPVHGEYSQLVYHKIRKKTGEKLRGCPRCAKAEVNHRKSLGKTWPEWFLEELSDESRESILNGEYSTNDKLHFVCPVHGDYYQVMRDHIDTTTMERKHGCTPCGYEIVKMKYISNLHGRQMRSMTELRVEEFIREHGYETQHARRILDGYEIDILVGNYGIEIDGYGHKECVDRDLFNQKSCACKWYGYHRNKDDIAKSKGIKLLHITHNSWYNDPSVRSKLLKFLQGQDVGSLIDLEDPTYGSIQY